MESLLRDLRDAVRSLRRSPGFAAVSVLTLAVGIGANSAMFSALESLLLRPLPYRDPNQVVYLQETRAVTGQASSVSPLNYLDWKNQNTAFETMAAVTYGATTITAGDTAVAVSGLRVSAEYFDVFGTAPMLGRAFVRGDSAPGAPRVAVLSRRLWAARFGSDPGVVGRLVRVDGQPATVVGVMPATATVDFLSTEIWTPLSWTAATLNRDFHSISMVVARVRHGLSVSTAAAQLDTTAERISRDHPDTNRGWGVVVRPYADLWVTSEFKRSLYLLLGAVGAVLLIGCVNLSNMSLARGLARDREVAVRSALGAPRRRLVQQFLTENLLIAAIGGVIGVGLASLLLTVLLRSIAAYEIPVDAPIAIDRRVLLFTTMLSLASALAFGLVPALSATRAAFSDTLKRSGPGASVGRRWRSALVVSEVALAVALLSGAGLLLRSFYRMQHTDPGFASANILTARLPVAASQSADREQMNTYLDRIVGRVASLPGVAGVALTDALPMHWPPYATFFQVAGRPPVDRAQRPLCDFKTVSPAYFPTVGVVLRRGWLLTERDRPGAPLVTVISETMARKYFPQQEPLGQRLVMRQIIAGSAGQFGPEVTWEIVGVLADERSTAFDDPTERPAMYVSYAQSPTPFQQLVIRSIVDVASIREPVRKAIAGINRDQVLSDVMTMDEVVAESEWSDRLRTTLVGAFALVATLLAAIGVYGVIAFTIGQRTREIGIRKALGASAANLQWLVARDLAGLALAGVLLGVGVSVGLGRLLAGFLFGISATDPVTIGGTTLLTVALCALAAYIPTRNIVEVDPMVTLSAE